ncbi:hypothetical protein MNBD_GAMMA26-1091 [hydrothermal vent metagenome]|uniref:Type II secretion system protein GspB C-terminal domain-containing protein n=1 Tax=hydrothermal vent metagenome TaxID=652676 RepID=A0A3B1B5D3_9ZZZZ
MSFILEALSKAENDRGTATSYTQALPPLVKNNSTSQRLLVCLILIAVSVLVLGGYLAVQHFNAPADKPESKILKSTVVTKTAIPKQPVKLMAARKQQLEIPPKAESVTNTNLSPPPLAHAEKKPTTIRHSNVTAYQVPSLHTMTRQHGKEAEDGAVSANNTPKKAYVKYEIAQPVEKKDSEAQLLPSSMHAQIPELEISVHMYSETPSKRFVYIQSARYGEGARISDGLVLEEITSTGVILDYRGSLYRLPIKM